MRFKVFISSVQREFAAERQMLAEYVRKDALLGKFFDVFLFEGEPACDVEARDLYLPELEELRRLHDELGDQINEIYDDSEDASSALADIHAEMETQLDALAESIDDE